MDLRVQDMFYNWVTEKYLQFSSPSAATPNNGAVSSSRYSFHANPVVFALRTHNINKLNLLGVIDSTEEKMLLKTLQYAWISLPRADPDNKICMHALYQHAQCCDQRHVHQRAGQSCSGAQVPQLDWPKHRRSGPLYIQTKPARKLCCMKDNPQE